MKKILNSLNKKDGNKLGRRKREEEWLKLEFKSKMNPVDIKAFAKDILENIGERKERLMLPKFTGTLSEILSMDKGISGGDFTACCTVGVGGEQDLWRSNVSHLMMMQAMKHKTPIVTIGTEIDKDEMINRMYEYIKDNPPETMIFPYSVEKPIMDRDILSEYTSNLKLRPAPNVTDEEYKWDGPIVDKKPEWLNPRMMDYISPIGESMDAKTYEACNQIFLRARTLGKTMAMSEAIFPVKIKK